MNKGLYIAVEYAQQSVTSINNYILKYVPNPVELDKLHTTIIYSRTWDDVKVNHWELYPAVIVGYDIWSPEYTDKSILVALLDSDKLSSRHAYLMNNYKLTYDFPEYKPHITLSYDVQKDYDYSKLIKYLTVVGVNEYSEDLNEND